MINSLAETEEALWVGSGDVVGAGGLGDVLVGAGDVRGALEDHAGGPRKFESGGTHARGEKLGWNDFAAGKDCGRVGPVLATRIVKLDLSQLNGSKAGAAAAEINLVEAAAGEGTVPMLDGEEGLI